MKIKGQKVVLMKQLIPSCWNHYLLISFRMFSTAWLYILLLFRSTVFLPFISSFLVLFVTSFLAFASSFCILPPAQFHLLSFTIHLLSFFTILLLKLSWVKFSGLVLFCLVVCWFWLFVVYTHTHTLWGFRLFGVFWYFCFYWCGGLFCGFSFG